MYVLRLVNAEYVACLQANVADMKGCSEKESLWQTWAT